MTHYSLFIDGKSVDTDETYDVVSPGDGTVIATLAKGGTGEVDAGAEPAAAAFASSWPSLIRRSMPCSPCWAAATPSPPC